jgi:hypothetical protein
MRPDATDEWESSTEQQRGGEDLHANKWCEIYG